MTSPDHEWQATITREELAKLPAAERLKIPVSSIKPAGPDPERANAVTEAREFLRQLPPEKRLELAKTGQLDNILNPKGK